MMIMTIIFSLVVFISVFSTIGVFFLQVLVLLYLLPISRFPALVHWFEGTSPPQVCFQRFVGLNTTCHLVELWLTVA